MLFILMLLCYYLCVFAANPNKMKAKKGYLATIPHITNIDPFHENQVSFINKE